jgi:hypothetical protein
MAILMLAAAAYFIGIGLDNIVADQPANNLAVAVIPVPVAARTGLRAVKPVVSAAGCLGVIGFCV